MKKVIVLVGPTGSGKTGLSIALAKRFGLEIINGDSVQVHQGLDIGSAKIKPHEQQGILHHLLDVCLPGDPYTVYHFQQDARRWIDVIDRPMIVGGTGLYIQAALYDYEFIEAGRDQTFEMKVQDLSNQALYDQLIALDPNIKIDVQNRRRLLRALEQATLGTPRSEKQKKDTLLYDALILYLDLDRQLLEPRLLERLDRQIQEGFIDEVRHLLAIDIRINAIGYREIAAYLESTYTLEQAKAEIIKATKRLAKKQKTWFKNQMHPIILDAQSPTLLTDAAKIIDAFLKEEA